MWSYETSGLGFVPWIITFLCLCIWYQWISPIAWTLFRVRTRSSSLPKPSDKFEKKDRSKLKYTFDQIPAQNLPDERSCVAVGTRYDENWFTSSQIFNLEQRAIFSKTWLFAIHRSRFTKPGDYHTLTLATFSIFLILGQDQEIRAFHNVCRHRAYTITKRTSGSSTVLGCRYHGWSYNTRGDLVRAPEFERVPGFDKKPNGLFQIRTKTTSEGSVFVNFDAGEAEPDFDVDNLNVVKSWKIGKCRWVSGWKLEGNFNWKVADAKDSSELNDDKMSIVGTWASTFPLFRKRADQRTLDIFPGTELYLSPSQKIWISIQYVPQSATKTTLQVDLHTSLARDDRSQVILESRLRDHFQDRVRRLEEKHASFTLKGIHKENGSKQDTIHSLLVAHLGKERAIGQEIYPAARMEIFSEAGKQDDDLCKELEDNTPQNLGRCLPSANGKDLLQW